MPIKNYTTAIKTEKTLAEIHKRLTAAGARAILSDYDEDQVLTSISFRVPTPIGLMSFQLPANIDKTHAVLVRQRVQPKFRSKEQAARVAWRILKDWLDAQLALIETEMVTVDQVFLPYDQTNTGETVYEKLIESGSGILLLTGGD